MFFVIQIFKAWPPPLARLHHCSFWDELSDCMVLEGMT